MLLAIDIGNTHISIGVFDLALEDRTPIFTGRLSADATRTPEEYMLSIRQLLSLHGIEAEALKLAAISSVVPALTDTLSPAARYFTTEAPLILGPGIRTGVNIRIDQQTQLGADLVANTAAALTLVSPPAVIVDFGTATTFAVVDRSGALTGAIICPGLRCCMDALAHSASLLADSDMSRPSSIVGKNTRDSVNSGIVNGHIILVDGFIRELRHTLVTEGEEKLALVATGGLAEYVIPHTRNAFIHIPYLTLRGIAEIVRRNR